MGSLAPRGFGQEELRAACVPNSVLIGECAQFTLPTYPADSGLMQAYTRWYFLRTETVYGGV